jgi:hypothetical protein
MWLVLPVMLLLDMDELLLTMEAGSTNTFASYSSWENGEFGTKGSDRLDPWQTILQDTLGYTAVKQV